MLNDQPSSYTTRFLRLSHIIGNPKANPPIPAIIPVSSSTFWNWVASGKAPKPLKLGPKITAWKTEDIMEFADKLGLDENQN